MNSIYPPTEGCDGMPPQTQTLDHYVAVFVPDVENNHWYHWSFSVCSGLGDHAWNQYEAVRSGRRSAFKIEYRNKDPRALKTCLWPLFHLASIDACRSQELFDAIDNVRPQKRNRGWNCQSYIHDLLSALVERSLVSPAFVSMLNRDLRQYEGKQTMDLRRVHHSIFHRRRKRAVLSQEFVDECLCSDDDV